MTGNEIGAITCIMMSAIFLLIALAFALLKEKGTILISGFNFWPAHKKAGYDQKRMSKDMCNLLIKWSILLIIGGLLSYLVSFYFSIIAWVIWFILFFREVKWSTEKAFEKYKI